MCFSATASFSLAGVLTAVGAGGIARNSRPQDRLFAAIPLIFAAQQAAEGVVWLTMPPSAHESLRHIATLSFLGFAVVVWPVWAPLALLRAERERSHQRFLKVVLAIGVAVSLASALLLVHESPIAKIAGHSIKYESIPIGTPAVGLLLTFVYLVPTIGPFFASTMRLSRTIGLTLVLSLAVTLLVERTALTSVWCFFAAILSCQTLMAVPHTRTARA